MTAAPIITLTAMLTNLIECEQHAVERFQRDLAGRTFIQLADDMSNAIAAEHRLGWYQRALKIGRDYDDAAAASWLEAALGDALGDSRQYTDSFQNGVITAKRAAARHTLSSLRIFLDATEVLDRIY